MEQPDDVTMTMAWLRSSGFELIEVIGGPEAPFGDRVHVFRRGDGTEVRIVVDRLQWAVDIKPSGATEAVDLEIAIQAREGWAEAQYRYEAAGAGEPLPQQLPVGVSWLEELPATIAWIGADRHAREKLVQASTWHGQAVRRYFLDRSAERDPQALARTIEESRRSYFREQHAKRHSRRRKPNLQPPEGGGPLR